MIISTTYGSVSKAPGLFEALSVHYQHYCLYNNHDTDIDEEMGTEVGHTCHSAAERQGR